MVGTMAGQEVWVVLCTFPDLAQARQIGTALVEKQLAACVNILPGVESIFCWENRVSSESEVLVLLKTGGERFAELERELVERHPYEVPEVIALPVEAGSEGYLNWVRQACGLPVEG